MSWRQPHHYKFVTPVYIKRNVLSLRSVRLLESWKKKLKWEIIGTLLKWLAYETCHKRRYGYVFILLELEDNVWRTHCTWVCIICVEKELKKCGRTCYKEVAHPKSHYFYFYFFQKTPEITLLHHIMKMHREWNKTQ